MNIESLLTEPNHADNLFARGRFIYDALCTPGAAAVYRAGEELAARLRTKTIIKSSDCDFDVESFAEAGLCALRPLAEHYADVDAGWDPDPSVINRSYDQAWYSITWEGAEVEVLRLGFPSACGTQAVRWLIADTPELAETFFTAVCAWNSAIEETILVFEDGYWQKNRDLYLAIQRATLDTLVLGGTLKEQLHRDLLAFFDARPVYERAGIPWKRGIVLIGPPGNGKTHAIMALINTLDKPCLYVKSFSSEHANEHKNIRRVFAKARETAPCILVLEDLDSLITDDNRSFFLNELDGFAANTGVVTLASTNYPERLDPAIMARPSRFDRKYHFGLPATAERLTYLELWGAGLDDVMRPSAATLAGIATNTEGFSFAYLKELLIAATVRWAEQQEPGTMDRIILGELGSLRDQMSSVESAQAPVEQQPSNPQGHPSRRKRGRGRRH
jgi:hypothetical protein